MTDLVHILHNTGAFGYRVLPLALFAFECLALLLAALWILGTVANLIAAIVRKRRFRRGVLIVAVFALVFGAFTFPGAYSKICFVQGYQHYLAADLPAASQFYLKSARLDRNFNLPLDGLVGICSEFADDDPLIYELEPLVRQTGRADLCARFAWRLGAAGRHAEAADLYAHAQLFSAPPATLWKESVS